MEGARQMNKYTREAQNEWIHGNWEDRTAKQFKSQVKRIGGVVMFLLAGWLVG